MKIKLTTLSLLLTLAVATSGTAQNYIERQADESVYDVEVIVFGQTLAQPALAQVKQANIFDQSAAAEVDYIQAESNLPKIKQPQPTPANNPGSQDNLQMPLTDIKPEYSVLVWYLLADQLSGGVVNRLNSNPKYKTLIRQVWRQPVTPFNNPLYVKVNNSPTLLTSDESLSPQYNDTTGLSNVNGEMMASGEQKVLAQMALQNVADYQVEGQVALSQGRFTHLHIKFNYYRINEEGKTIVYASKQQKQINLNKWQYFDHQQFGVLVKVTAVKAEELL